MDLKRGPETLANAFGNGKTFSFLELICLLIAVFLADPIFESIFASSLFASFCLIIRVWTIRYQPGHSIGKNLVIAGPYRFVQFPYLLSCTSMLTAVSVYSRSVWFFFSILILSILLFKLCLRQRVSVDQSLRWFEYDESTPKLLPNLLPYSPSSDTISRNKKNKIMQAERLEAPLMLLILCGIQWLRLSSLVTFFSLDLIHVFFILMIIVRLFWIYRQVIGEIFHGVRSRFKNRSRSYGFREKIKSETIPNDESR